MICTFDCMLYEDYDYKTEVEELKEHIRKFDTKQEAVITLLQEYYEIRSDYGDPISDLVPYIPENSLNDILEKFDYLVSDSFDVMCNKISRGEDLR